MKQRILCFTMALLCLFSVSMLSASATTALDTERECSLTIHYTADGQSLPGLQVSLYRVAEALPDGTFQRIALFKDYPVSIYGITTQTGWKQTADTLMGYVAADGISSTATATTNEEGKAVFTGLATGLYLVENVAKLVGSTTWSFDSFMLYLPMQEEGVYTYDVTAKPKGSQSKPIPGDTQYKLLKLWKDAGHADARPEAVTVEIHKDGERWKTVSLSEENNWAYTWTDLEGTANWSVVERDVPAGYTVTVTPKSTSFVVTNTYEPDVPDAPDKPGTPDTPDKPDDPDAPEKPNTPQTGDTEPLWLYVLLMVFSGLALMLLGVGGMRGQKYGKTK